MQERTRETSECQEERETWEEKDRKCRFITQPQYSVQKGRAKTGMNVSFISFCEITPWFNPVKLVSSRHRNGARNENTLFVNSDKYQQLCERRKRVCRTHKISPMG